MVERWERLGRAIGLASLALGVWGVAAPSGLGRILGMEDETVRVIGFRDLGSGWLILAGGGPLAYASRSVFDLGDAVTMARRKPLVALGAMAAAVTSAALAVLASPRSGR